MMIIRRLDGEASFSLAGEMDMSSEAALRGHLLPVAGPGATVRLDVGEVSFVDSSGLNLLIQILQAVGEDGRLILSTPQPFIRRLLRVSGVERHPGLVLD